MKKILFVCLGNICRSPAAEGVFRTLAEQRGIASSLQIDSAGTAGYHVGDLPDERMRKAAARRGYQLNSRGRKAIAADLHEFDYIFAMDQSNLRNLRSLDPSGKYHPRIKLFTDYYPGGTVSEVPDPYYGGPEGFEEVLDIVEKCSNALLDELAGVTC